MKTKIVRIGNSRGVRIPKPLLEQAGLENEVILRVVDDGIVIESADKPRAGWAEAARTLSDRGEDELLDDMVLTDFDEVEGGWEEVLRDVVRSTYFLWIRRRGGKSARPVRASSFLRTNSTITSPPFSSLR